MTAAHPAGSPAARLRATISAARTACPGQPDRAEQREPRSGALDRPPQRSYPYQHQPTARPARCGLIDRRICGVDSDTPQAVGDLRVVALDERELVVELCADVDVDARPERGAIGARRCVHGHGAAVSRGGKRGAGGVSMVLMAIGRGVRVDPVRAHVGDDAIEVVDDLVERSQTAIPKPGNVEPSAERARGSPRSRPDTWGRSGG